MREALFALGLVALTPISGFAEHMGHCQRPAAGSAVGPPADLFSEHGALNVVFDYYTTVDTAGRSLFCFETPDGLQAPTLHVKPGDELNIKLTNRVPPPPPGSPTEVVSKPSNRCGDATMTQASVNMHFHGTNTSPVCPADQVIHTVINSGQTFQYQVRFPHDEPPGLYWYHPHIHGLAEAAVQGGASGVIIVDGIANFEPAVAGLPERVLVIRDQTVAANPQPDTVVPAWDISLNYVPVPYPSYTPAVIKMKPGQREFWRVANASADTIMDLQLRYDGAPQLLQVVGLDGVPVGSQDGARQGKMLMQYHILIPPAGRAEFIVTGPSDKIKDATFLTRNVDTGPDGDIDPERPLATIIATSTPPRLPIVPWPSERPDLQRFEGIHGARPTAERKLYFSEVISDPSNPASPTDFFITVEDATPTLFDAANPPAITTTQGSIEDWTIENRTGENHEFHMHQIHFLLLAENGVPVPWQQQQFYDTFDVPYWTGSGPYPSITVRMDFRGPDVGDFVYHCHILGHEDGGMMAILRVLPRHH